jgi:hypothetical protein
MSYFPDMATYTTRARAELELQRDVLRTKLDAATRKARGIERRNKRLRKRVGEARKIIGVVNASPDDCAGSVYEYADEWLAEKD